MGGAKRLLLVALFLAGGGGVAPVERLPRAGGLLLLPAFVMCAGLEDHSRLQLASRTCMLQHAWHASLVSHRDSQLLACAHECQPPHLAACDNILCVALHGA